MAASLFVVNTAGAEPADKTPPTVSYVGPSDRMLTDIYVGIDDDNSGPDLSATVVGVTRSNLRVAYSTSVAGPGLLRLALTSPTDGVYSVTVTPRDVAGNVGAAVTRSVVRGSSLLRLNAYGAFQGGASTAAGDVDGDHRDEIITAAGPGGGPHVRVFAVDPLTQTAHQLASFMAYDPNFTGGVRVAAADVDGDGKDEIITAPGPGGGPNIKVFRVLPNGGAQLTASFMAYAPNVTVGINVAGGDINGDGKDEVLTAPEAGVGPHVRAWAINGGTNREVAGFMAYAPAFTGGVRVAAADVDADGTAEIVTGAGPGGGPHVQVFSLSGSNVKVRYSFMAYEPNFAGGVSVSSGDVDGHGDDELLLSAGGGGGPHVRVLSFASGAPVEIYGFMAYDPNFHGGVSAAAGDLDGDGDDDIITTPGPGMPVMINAQRPG